MSISGTESGGEPSHWRLPPVVLGHLMSLTSDLGIIQHCKFSDPDPRHGYSIDDQARGLIVASLLAASAERKSAARLARVTLAYIERAALPQGGFHNFLSADGRWLDKIGSGDSLGRTIWALGVAAASPPNPASYERSLRLLNDHLPCVCGLRSPRALAFSLLGCCEVVGARIEELGCARDIGLELGARLLGSFEGCATEGWPWFEEVVTYSNARLPESLFCGARLFGRPEWTAAAVASLGFLMEVTTTEDVFAPIGNKGWLRKGGERAAFDQQPVDAASMVDACLAAYDLTGDSRYFDFAVSAMDWYYGKNMLGLSLYDPSSGAVYDGLGETEVNLNQGAESVLTYLMARINVGKHLVGKNVVRCAVGVDRA